MDDSDRRTHTRYYSALHFSILRLLGLLLRAKVGSYIISAFLDVDSTRVYRNDLVALGFVIVLKYSYRWFCDQVLNNWAHDTYDWDKEIVLITGAAGGIGTEMVRLFRGHGIRVVMLDQKDPSPEPSTLSKPTDYYICDTSSPTSVAKTAALIRTKIGDPTIIINNAGVAYGDSIMASHTDDIQSTFKVNTLSSYWLAKEFLQPILRNNHGMFVTMASFSSFLTVPGMVSYAASKAAAVSFHEGLTSELKTKYNAPAVRTVLVTLGYTKTPLFAGWMERSGAFMRLLMPPLEPVDVAHAVVDQVMSGRSGEVVMPYIGNFIGVARGLPTWMQVLLRNTGQGLMDGFKGRRGLASVVPTATLQGR